MKKKNKLRLFLLDLPRDIKLFAIPVFYFSGLYRTIFRYSGWDAMLTVSKSIIIYGFLFSTFITLISFRDVPRTIGIIQPIIIIFYGRRVKSINKILDREFV